MGGGATKIIEDYELRYDDNQQDPVKSISLKSTRSTMRQSTRMKSSISIKNPDKIDETKQVNMDGSSVQLPLENNRRAAVKNSYTVPWVLKVAKFKALSCNDFEFGRTIGKGLMGSVKIAKFKYKNSYLAIKCISKDFVIKHKDERHIFNEKKVLTSLKSPFCIKLFGTFQNATHVFLALELAVGGELFERLKKKEVFGPQTAKFYAAEVCSALCHLHSLGYCHRDLKPENVLLDEDGHCKLIDFGFSREPDNESGLMKTVCGTPAYLSPEQLNGKYTNGYSKIVDWWALGILIYELLTGQTPFCKSDTDSNYEIYLRILNSKVTFSRNFDIQSKDLISNLCQFDVNKRLVSVEAIKSHPYFSLDWDKVDRRKLKPPYVPKVNGDGDSSHFREYSDVSIDGITYNEKSSTSKFFEGF
eukprot:gene18146-23800_t